jgi:hypothetical protein
MRAGLDLAALLEQASAAAFRDTWRTATLLTSANAAGYGYGASWISSFTTPRP